MNLEQIAEGICCPDEEEQGAVMLDLLDVLCNEYSPLHETLILKVFPKLLDVINKSRSSHNQFLAMKALSVLLSSFEEQKAALCHNISCEMVQMLMTQLASKDAACSKQAADSLVAISKISKMKMENDVEGCDVTLALLSIYPDLEAFTAKGMITLVATVNDVDLPHCPDTWSLFNSVLIRALHRISQESLDLLLQDPINLLLLIKNVLRENRDPEALTLACAVLATYIKGTNDPRIWRMLNSLEIIQCLRSSLDHDDKQLLARILDCVSLFRESSIHSSSFLSGAPGTKLCRLLTPSSGVCKEALCAVRSIITDGGSLAVNQSNILSLFQRILELLNSTEASQELRAEAYRTFVCFLRHADDTRMKTFASESGFLGVLFYRVRNAPTPEAKLKYLRRLLEYVEAAEREGDLELLIDYYNNHPEAQDAICASENVGKEFHTISSKIKTRLNWV